MGNKRKQMKHIFSLNLICFLRCKGIDESNVGFNDTTKKVYFVYEDNEQLERLIEEYRDTDAVVRLHDFIGEFKALKEEMYMHTKSFMK